MENFIKILGAGIAAMIVIAIVAVLGGTLVFWFWPHAIPYVLPGLVSSGMIAAKLTWWKAVLFTWICAILFKGGSSNSKSD